MQNYELYEAHGSWTLVKEGQWQISFENKETALEFLKIALLEDA